ncbi:hypothetical protein F5144DRAFT_354801 [Chaetomium tenue]|uniref:Uncharacterized protein n=1 Tax=Chaetomium tenue TaxID=1854479 RepID=A0ACB7P3H2_9PEZI|nr:hypothetical protein F5144DRAFT_354801 [Chaetomium globosum]
MLFVHNEKTSALAHRHNQHHHHHQQLHPHEKHCLSPHARHRPSDPSQPPSRKCFLDSLLDTFHDWEGTTRASGSGRFLDGTLPSGRMSVDFMQYGTGGYHAGGYHTNDRYGYAGEEGVGDGHHHHSLGGKSVRTASNNSSSTVVGSGVGVVESRGEDDEERPDSAKTLTGPPHVYEVAQVARPVSARIVTTHGSQSSQDMGFRFDFGGPGGMR